MRIRVPVPLCVRLPVPEIPAVLKFVPWVTVLLRLNERVPLLRIALLVERDPSRPPLPSCRVPPLIVVAPE